MTHFLSNVTQQRLEVRKVDMERTDSPSLVCNPENVHGQLRCIATATTSAGKHGDGGQVPCVWCGEQDGTITVRSGTGEYVLQAIAKKQLRSGSQAAFVFCLCTPRHDQVWAGLSDGSIRVFHPRTCEVLFEFHAHASSVVAFAVVSMPTNDDEFEHHMNIVVSASTDWTIAKWDTTTFQCLGKLLGHRVAIRCLAPSQSGEFLVSGGEDGTLRMWSLMRNEEVLGSSDGARDIEDDAVASLVEAEDGTHPPGIRWPVAAHDAGISGVCVIRDEIIVSTGLDGVALLWSLSGECLHELDRRGCGLSSVVHDVTCARIWVGGIDGNINLFSDDPDLRWQPLGTARDHSGAYVSTMSVTRVDHLQRMWLLDENGVATQFAETLDGGASDEEDLRTEMLADGAVAFPQGSGVSIDVCEAMEALDDLRQTAVQSYSELRRHRLRLAGAEAFQRKQRERLVLAFGDGVRERQSTVYRLQRWLERKQCLAVTMLRCEWMARASHRSFLSICLWKWVLYARECAVTNTKSKVADAFRALTSSTLKSHTARQLKLSLQEKERWRHLNGLVGVLEVRGSNVLRSIYFGKWLAGLVTQRKAANRTYLASARSRLSDITSQHINQRNHALALLIERRGQRLHHLSEQLQILNVWPCMAKHYAKWSNFLLARRIERRQTQAATVLQRHDLTVLRQYYRKWQRHAAERSRKHEQERNDDLEAELRMWQDLIREASTTTIEVLQREQANEAEKALQRKDALAALKSKAATVLEDIHMIKSDLVATGLRLQPGLDLDAKVDAIFTYMKARGINAHRDFPTINAAREDFAVLPLYVAPSALPLVAPGMLGRSSPVRKTSVGGGRRGSSPSAGQKPAPAKKKAPPRPRSLLIDLENELKRLQVLVTQAVRGTDAAVLHQADQLRLIQHGEDVLDDNDWCVTPESIQRLTRKDLRESAACLRRIIVLYDCIRCKQDEAASTTPLYRTAPVAPPPPAIPDDVLRIILCNAASMIKLAAHDFGLSALEYVTAEEGSSTKLRNEDRDATAPRPAVRKTPVAASGGVVRRHSSPAASNRAATTTPTAVRQTSPARPLGKASPAPQPATPRPVLRAAASASPARPSPETSIAADGASPVSKPAPKLQTSPKQPTGPKPFLGLRVSVGPPLASTSRVPSLVVAECNEAYPIEGPDGASSVEGPAFSAGLRVGDVIVRFAGYAVADLAAFNAIVARHCKPNAVIPLQVLSSATQETKILSITVRSK